MQQEKAAVVGFLKDRRLSQEELARAAKVDQSTISRILKGEVGRRHSKALKKVLEYIKRKSSKTSTGSKRGSECIVHAFERIWDGSDAHANKVAEIIDSLSGLSVKRERSRRRRA